MRSASWSSSWPGRTRIRTVGSHLDRIRDKTGGRRRADLTQLPLQAGLI
jgi:DNA-binding CsgD family transcriptional regulator